MFMGVFTQLHRAWMSIDHTLFLWDYTDPRGGFYHYQGLDQAIIHAAVVPCRRGRASGVWRAVGACGRACRLPACRPAACPRKAEPRLSVA